MSDIPAFVVIRGKQVAVKINANSIVVGETVVDLTNKSKMNQYAAYMTAKVVEEKRMESD